MTVKFYTCTSCGAAMEFDPAQQKVVCPHCGSVKSVDFVGRSVEEQPLTIDAVEGMSRPKATMSQFCCSSCGAKLDKPPGETAAMCPYCGSTMVKSLDIHDSAAPDGVIPFGFDKKSAVEKLRKWASKRWFAPNALKDAYYTDNLTGVYLPFYTFDAVGTSVYTAQGGRNHTVTRVRNGKREVHTEIHWYPTSGRVSAKIDDLLINAGTGGLDTNLLGNVMQFNTAAAAPYSPDFMAGFAAQVYSLPLQDAVGQSARMMQNMMLRKCEQDVLSRFHHVRAMSANTNLSNRTYKYLLAPVYSSSYRYKNQTYQVLINGQTGEIAGRYPKSGLKIAAAVLAAAIALVGLLWIGDILDESSYSEPDYNYGYDYDYDYDPGYGYDPGYDYDYGYGYYPDPGYGYDY